MILSSESGQRLALTLNQLPSAHDDPIEFSSKRLIGLPFHVPVAIAMTGMSDVIPLPSLLENDAKGGNQRRSEGEWGLIFGFFRTLATTVFLGFRGFFQKCSVVYLNLKNNLPFIESFKYIPSSL